MLTRIEVFSKIEDRRAWVMKKEIEKPRFEEKIKTVKLFDVYTINKNFQCFESGLKIFKNAVKYFTD